MCLCVFSRIYIKVFWSCFVHFTDERFDGDVICHLQVVFPISLTYYMFCRKLDFSFLFSILARFAQCLRDQVTWFPITTALDSLRIDKLIMTEFEPVLLCTQHLNGRLPTSSNSTRLSKDSTLGLDNLVTNVGGATWSRKGPPARATTPSWHTGHRTNRSAQQTASPMFTAIMSGALNNESCVCVCVSIISKFNYLK